MGRTNKPVRGVVHEIIDKPGRVRRVKCKTHGLGFVTFEWKETVWKDSGDPVVGMKVTLMGVHDTRGGNRAASAMPRSEREVVIEEHEVVETDMGGRVVESKCPGEDSGGEAEVVGIDSGMEERVADIYDR